MHKKFYKNASFVKKNAKLRGIKVLKNIPLHLESLQ